jgi:putative ABC transport system substrate-binding protein
MKNRRKLIVMLGVIVAAPLMARAQPQTKRFRIGILATDSFETRRPLVDVFIQAMREYGYVEGKNVSFDARYANGDAVRLSALATELVGQSPDVIVVPNGQSTQAAARATAQANRAIPIVFAGWATPLGSGLVATLARPGGNVTGVSNIAVELAAKQMELLKAVFPQTLRVAVFVDSSTSAAGSYLEQMEGAAKRLGVQTLPVELRSAEDIEQVMGTLRKWRADAIYVPANPINQNNRKPLVHVAEKMRLPAVYGNDAFVEIGGLMSYGSDDKLRWRQIATFVDKILRGTNPGEIPVELPTTFKFVVNIKTAKALGITIPQTILVRADMVIE